MDNSKLFVDNFSYTSGESTFTNINLREEHAGIFLKDAVEFRSIEHKIDETGRAVHRFLYSRYWPIIVTLSIICLHLLAFFEYPSSLSTSSLVNATQNIVGRIDVPLVPLVCLEAAFLSVIMVDSFFEIYINDFRKSSKKPLIITLFIVFGISWIEFLVNVGIPPPLYTARIRRFLRPYFVIYKSLVIREVLISTLRTMKDLLSPFILYTGWIIGFSVIAMLTFSGFQTYIDPNYTSFYSAFFQLMVLLTTCNNPDAIIVVVSYNRLNFIFFIIFVSVGMYTMMNLITAITYDHFRGHLVRYLQVLFYRRRIASRALFEVLKEVTTKQIPRDDIDAYHLRRVIQNSSLHKWRKQLMEKKLNSLGKEVLNWDDVNSILLLLDEEKNSRLDFCVPTFKKKCMQRFQRFVLSKTFEIIALSVCVANVIVIAVDVSIKVPLADPRAVTLNVFNFIFISLYVVEQTTKFIMMGARTYFGVRGTIFDFIITVIIVIMKVVESVFIYGYNVTRTQYIFGYVSLWDFTRMISLVIILRAIRVVLLLPGISPMIKTLFDIPWRMKPLLAILAMMFYIYALLGMNIFGGCINMAFMSNSTTVCGSFQQSNYGALNFNDFYASLVVLWCLLILNQWHALVIGFTQAMGNSSWYHIYFFSWWILAVNVCLKCITAAILEAYTQRKMLYDEEMINRKRKITVTDQIEESIRHLHSTIILNHSINIQILFKKDLCEPNDEHLLNALKHCEFLCSHYPHIQHSKYGN